MQNKVLKIFSHRTALGIYGLFFLLGLFLLPGSLFLQNAQASNLSPVPEDVPVGGDNLNVTVVAEGLDFPWSLAFLPSGDMLVTEREGSIRLVDAEGNVSPALNGVPEAYVRGQGGMMDIILHPDFEENGWIYFTYAWGDYDANGTRLARARLQDESFVDLEVLFTTQPLKQNTFHYGGRMVWMPDGTLMLTMGEGNRFREQAQQLDSHLGKLLRLNDDGSPAADNPFIDQEGARPEIWSYGHRNPQGIVWDAEAGVLYSHEHGPRGGDEINIIQPGLNYGWPEITYGINYSGTIITDYKEKPGMEQPLLYYVPSTAPAGFAQVRGEMFSDWDGDLLIANLAGMELRRVDMQAGEIVGQERLLVDMNKRFRDVRIGPEGAIYVLTDEEGGQILRLTP